ncbi:MAG: UDP-N-acetylmuramoyl-L-alanine--D-glutamate ligase [Actinobacteria bacterium]|nr:UDP-N-acetylmuramoyl-L-alanine--D-glutamate ligase [Actinomycetota bacterium]
MTTTLVYGLAVAGRAVANELVLRGEKVILADDQQTDGHSEFARSMNSEIVFKPSVADLQAILGKVDRVSPAPGIAESHQLFEAARKLAKPMMSEIELAYRFEQDSSSPRPMVAVTGTDGKTTTTLMAAAILKSANHNAMAVGNTETPLIAALRTDADAFAVECSSFRLALTQTFRAKASVWLNFAPDHLDWHASFDAYQSAKAKIWAHLLSSDVAVVPAHDDVIAKFAQKSGAKVVSFGQNTGDYHASNGVLMCPSGEIMHSSEMARSLPHDVTNALAAAAITIESGLANRDQVARALRSFVNAPHRIEFTAEHGGVRWFNDSKATSPHASSVALKSFKSIVLIAGGKNKDLDLKAMSNYSENVKAVVAIGNAAQEIKSAFSGICEVRVANSMQEAVSCADQIAVSGDVVLLSPGCTSYDWYKNYGERGIDFKSKVQALIQSKREIEKEE